MLDELSKPFVIADDSLVVTASTGIAAFPEGGDDADVLMRNADTAMCQVKQQDENTFRTSPAQSSSATASHRTGSIWR